MSQNFNKLCRTCLLETEESNSKSLFFIHYVHGEPLKLCDVLAACASIEILEDDQLPKQVCLQCEHNIINAFSFQQQCQKSDSLLRSIELPSPEEGLSKFKPLTESTVIEESTQCTSLINEEPLSDSILNLHEDTASFPSDEEENIPHCNESQVESVESTSKRHKILNKDKKDETLQPLFPCEVDGCSACFTSSRDLKRHNKTHFSNPNYCQACTKYFSSASTLSRHVTSKHQPRRSHACYECGKSFARSDELKRHIRVHTGERPFSCEKCGKAFAQSFRLLEHMRSHSDIKNFICAVCGKGFARYTSLLAHNKTHNRQNSHRCPLCGKLLCGSGSLAMHMKIHTGQKDYVCNFCSKTFTSSSNLVVHTRTHTGEKPYTCQTCGKSFPDNSRLNVHIRIHSGEKPYICSYCERGCITSTQLKRHLLVHTKIRPYSCELCSRSFKRSEELKNHTRAHNGEKNHVCPVCEKAFFQKSSLKNHVMKIHPDACEETLSESRELHSVAEHNPHCEKPDNCNDLKVVTELGQTDINVNLI